MGGDNTLQLERRTKDGSDTVAIAVDNLIIAGWTGRNQAAMKAHTFDRSQGENC